MVGIFYRVTASTYILYLPLIVEPIQEAIGFIKIQVSPRHSLIKSQQNGFSPPPPCSQHICYVRVHTVII